MSEVAQEGSTESVGFIPYRQEEAEAAKLGKEGRKEITGDGRVFVFPAGTAQFLISTYLILENPETQDIVSWDWGRYSGKEEKETGSGSGSGSGFGQGPTLRRRKGGRRHGRKTGAVQERSGAVEESSPENPCRLVIHNVRAFEETVLPSAFRHKRCSSFVRQLNSYGFHKVAKNTYSHGLFRRTNLESIGLIQRQGSRTGKVASSVGSSGSKSGREKRERERESTSTSSSETSDETAHLSVESKRQRVEETLGVEDKLLMQLREVPVGLAGAFTERPSAMALVESKSQEVLLLKAQMRVMMQQIQGMQMELQSQENTMRMMESEMQRMREEKRHRDGADSNSTSSMTAQQGGKGRDGSEGSLASEHSLGSGSKAGKTESSDGSSTERNDSKSGSSTDDSNSDGGRSGGSHSGSAGSRGSGGSGSRSSGSGSSGSSSSRSQRGLPSVKGRRRARSTRTQSGPPGQAPFSVSMRSSRLSDEESDESNSGSRNGGSNHSSNGSSSSTSGVFSLLSSPGGLDESVTALLNQDRMSLANSTSQNIITLESAAADGMLNGNKSEDSPDNTDGVRRESGSFIVQWNAKG